MKYSFKIGSAWKIPIELHITFILIIAAVFILSLISTDFYIFFLAIFLFIFVFFHELAHSVIARHYGIKVRKIILYPIGGVSEIEEIADNPTREWHMAIAGPLTSLALGASLLLAGLLLFPQEVQPTIFITITGNLLFDLATLNIVLGAFNLVPAFPMDGGRVFRGLLAERMKFSDATRYAVSLGKIFGIAMIIIGFVFTNFFLLILVGIFVYIGASEEGEQTIISTTLAGIRVKDVMQSEFSYMNPKQNIAEALEAMFKNRYHDVLVVDNDSFQGVITWDELMKIDQDQRKTKTIGQLPLSKIFVFEDESILEANKVMARQRISLIPVLDRKLQSKVVGVLTSEALTRAYEKARNR